MGYPPISGFDVCISDLSQCCCCTGSGGSATCSTFDAWMRVCPGLRHCLRCCDQSASVLFVECWTFPVCVYATTWKHLLGKLLRNRVPAIELNLRMKGREMKKK